MSNAAAPTGAAGDPAPIGVFDSGVGGLTVARAIMGRLPREGLVYVGDTARVPYGPKSPETVRRYAEQIGTWLVEQGVKLVVVACNTATAHALSRLREVLPVPVIGVIEPGARAAVAASHRRRIGVIGTAGTINSGAYLRALHQLEPALEVHAQPCPLLVPLIEEGWIDHAATRLIVHEYLADLEAARIDTLVLGCTHYPLLRDTIAREVGPTVTLIDSAEETAAEVERVLAQTGRSAPEAGSAPTHRFIASDAPRHFAELGSRLLDRPLETVEHHVFT